MTTADKLVVEVIDARNLLPKDGHGTSSPYVILDFHGQRKRTQTAVRELNPTWNQVFEFNVGKNRAIQQPNNSDIFGDILEIDVFHDRSYGPTTRNHFLGRVRLSSTSDHQCFVRKGEEALIYHPLQKKHLFSWVQGEIGLKIYFIHLLIPSPPPLPPTPPSKETKCDTGEKFEPAPTHDDGQNGNENSVKIPDSEQKNDGENLNLNMEPEMNACTMSEDVTVLGDGVNQHNSDFRGPKPIITRTASVSSFSSESTEFKSSFDLVNKMHYLFVRVVKARSLPTNGNPVVKISVLGSQVESKPARKNTAGFFEWDQTFAFFHDKLESAGPILEVSVLGPSNIAAVDNFMGGVCFDVTDVPLRDPPDSPLAPQWYRLEEGGGGGGSHKSDLMLATWVGTQADESFPEACNGDSNSHTAKIYQSPKMWYLRLTIFHAQDIFPSAENSSFQIKAQLGFQVLNTKFAVSNNGSPSWNEDLIFVAAEPFGDQQLLISLEQRQQKKEIITDQRSCKTVIPIPLSSIERRIDDHLQVGSRWFTLTSSSSTTESDATSKEESNHIIYRGRIQLSVCFDGGYHVIDEIAHNCSDPRPTARQLWKPAVGIVELGIIGCKNLVPMKTNNVGIGEGSTTDAYVVAKYGNKWVKTRCFSDNQVDPKWNEQYMWEVYDPSTVLTIAVFDSNDNSVKKQDSSPIGKIRCRISSLQNGKVFTTLYPLMILSPTGLKKMGQIELALRFVRQVTAFEYFHNYSQPLLPLMHQVKPIGAIQQEILRVAAVKLVAAHLSQSEPQLRPEVVNYVLNSDSDENFSMRKVRVNWFRIMKVLARVIEMGKWVEKIRSWKNPTSTILAHVLMVMLILLPDLIIPTLAFYTFGVGAWNYRLLLRSGESWHFDPLVETLLMDMDELDEEFDGIPSGRSDEVVRGRYDKMRGVGLRVQKLLGDVATEGERMQGLVTWEDPSATGIFLGLCLLVGLVVYLVPTKMVALGFGFYYLRHPIFRDRKPFPPPALNFFRRLPSMSGRIM